MRIELVLRKLNLDYKKIITLRNLYNSYFGSKTIEVRASNLDTHQVLYHSAFYKTSVGNKFGRDF